MDVNEPFAWLPLGAAPDKAASLRTKLNECRE